jgi:hypothetical protein
MFSCPTDMQREPTDKTTLVVLEFDEEDEELHAIVVRMRKMVKPRPNHRP